MSRHSIPVDPPTVKEADPPVSGEVHAGIVAQNKRLKETIKGKVHLTVRQILKDMGLSPVKELINLAQEVDANGKKVLSSDQQIKIWSELLQYEQPKLKSVEHSGKVEQELTIIVKKFDAPEEGIVLELPRIMPQLLAEGTKPLDMGATHNPVLVEQSIKAEVPKVEVERQWDDPREAANGSY